MYEEDDYYHQKSPPTGCLLVIVMMIAMWAFIICSLWRLSKQNVAPSTPIGDNPPHAKR